MHSRQANDAVASEPSIFSENHDYKSFFRVAVSKYVPIFRDLDARGGRNLRTNTHTHKHTLDNEHNTNKNRRGHIYRRGHAACSCIFGCISGTKEFYDKPHVHF